MSLHSIGETARLTGLSHDTLRYYEKLGLLTEVGRDAAGRRLYGERHLATLGFIRRAQAMGFSLEEIARLLQFRRDPRNARAEARALTRAKLDEVEIRLEELTRLRDELRLLLNLCGCADEQADCPILDSLESGDDP